MIRRKGFIASITALSVSAILVAGCSINAVPTPGVAPAPVTEQNSQPPKEKPSAKPVEDTENIENGEDEMETIGVGVNLIPGGDLIEKNTAWGIYTESGGSASFDVFAKKLTLKISDPGKVGHAVQLYCGGFELLEGGSYTFSAEISSDTERTFEWRIQQNGGDYHPYVDIKDIQIGPDPVTVTSEFVMREASDPAPRMCFNLGDEGRTQGLGAHSIVIRNISLILVDDTNAKKVEKMDELMDINIDQIGYRTGDEKRAVLRNKAAKSSRFELIDAASNECVYEGSVVSGNTGGSSGDKVSYADFSDYKTPGRYKVKSDSGIESYEFDIKDDVYASALSDSLRMFYLQRCGCELPESLAGDFAHKPCHTEEALIYGGNKYLEVTGGWHDAGDYGRYTAPAAKAVADLLLAYDLYPDAFADEINIPESGNGLPDILNEARYELDWLHKMQAADGGVYHKVTGLNFDGFVKADECTEKLYLLPESKTSTADFAGVMFMASRVYEKFDADFSQKCKNAADRALAAYIEHINDRNYTNPTDVNTGEYADGNSMDEFLWAIMEGYKTTGDSKY